MFLFDTFAFKPNKSMTVFGKTFVQKFHDLYMLNQLQLKISFFNEIEKMEQIKQ